MFSELIINRRECRLTVYLDNSATTRVCPEAAETVTRALTSEFGNPSSLHSLGTRAYVRLEAARRSLAASAGAKPEEMVFTSGGTEANNLVIFGAAGSHASKKHFVTSAGEHHSVLEAFKRLEHLGAEVTILPLSSDGTVDLTGFPNALKENTALISVMAVNNETGAVNNTEQIYKTILAHYHGKKRPFFHTDGVQALTKIPLSLAFADMITLSAHKIHGPKGSGALAVKKGCQLSPMFFGGGQERNLRPGTENLPGILGFAAALEACPPYPEQPRFFKYLYDYTCSLLSGFPFVKINSAGGVYSILNFSVLGIKSETMLHFLAKKDIFVSSGSACSKGKKSHVLAAMHLPENVIDSALRVSFSRENKPEDIDVLCAALQEGYEHIYRKGKL
ncbi:MAG: cysteine desulfurase [Oscillospiraceae bacterium]|jgi:cysteine desulfurase|nr:cysteine desulfurase [Oscillospiraceae bacterium]